MCHFYNKNRKNLLIICPILNLQGCKYLNVFFINPVLPDPVAPAVMTKYFYFRDLHYSYVIYILFQYIIKMTWAMTSHWIA